MRVALAERRPAAQVGSRPNINTPPHTQREHTPEPTHLEVEVLCEVHRLVDRVERRVEHKLVEVLRLLLLGAREVGLVYRVVVLAHDDERQHARARHDDGLSVLSARRS